MPALASVTASLVRASLSSPVLASEPEPDEPNESENADGKDGLIATGDPGAGVAYVLLAGGAGMIALGRAVRVHV